MLVKIGFNVNDTEASLGALLRELAPTATCEDQSLQLDLSACQFLGPMAVTVLVLAHQRWQARGCRVSVIPPKLERLANYCVYSGLAERFDFGPVPETKHPENVTTPVSVFTKRDHNAILDVCSLVSRFIDMSHDTEEVLQSLIGEMMQNVADHAGHAGAISARVYKKERDVRVCVTDLGKGLRCALADRYAVKDDRDALRLALEYGKSSKSNAQNAGQGLNLLDNSLKSSGGSLLLASGLSYYRRTPDHCHVRDLPSPLPGTLVLMKFRIDNEFFGFDSPDAALW